MESPQSIVSPFKTSSMFQEPKNQNLDLFPKNPSFITKKPEPEPNSYLGILDVHIHQARDIQNICIYHKQDVYAKLCITTNPAKSVTTRTINGGGKNPIFNETLQVHVPTVDSSLKCEIYMLSRVKNYLEDQLLGFTLIPLSEILIKNGKLDKEFTLSSTDLFHSPSGFVHLSLSYTGASPDIMAVPLPPDTAVADSEVAEFDKIEFPDPKILKENHMMVNEYFGLSSESLVSSDSDDQVDQFDQVDQIEAPKSESPPASVSTNESKCANQENNSGLNEKPAKIGDPEVDSVRGNLIKTPILTGKIDFDQKVVQQDFVDLYMKSMQQFTESLANMKLPLDVEKEGPDSGNSGSGQKIQTPNGSQTRVFYGSRAFF